MSTDQCHIKHIKTENDIDEETLPAPCEKFEKGNLAGNVDAQSYRSVIESYRSYMLDPLKIDEDIADGASHKLEIDTIPNIEIDPKEEPPWENNSGIKSEIDIDEGIFGTIEALIKKEVNDGIDPLDPLKIEEDIADGAIHKLKEYKLPNIKVNPKEEPRWENNSDVKSEIDIDEGIFEKTKFSDGKAGKAFTRKDLLIGHRKIDTGKKRYCCDICGKSLGYLRSLIAHKRLHTGDKPYNCDICDKSFIEKKTLTKHKRIHAGKKPHCCDICEKSFFDKSHLTSHRRIHTGEKPYKCDICDKSFNEKHSLKKHRRTHTGEKPYKCDVCSKLFGHSNSLISHKRGHSGEKLYNCDICDSSFAKKSALKEHRRIHTGEKL